MSESFELDFDRKRRLGFPEAIFGASKTLAVLIEILQVYRNREENALATKVQPEKGRELLQRFPGSFYEELSGVFILDQSKIDREMEPAVGVLSAGTSDQFIVNEVYHTLAFLGIGCACINDVGVAGVHRLLNKLDTLRKFRALVVIAGFEGALPTVVGGLLPQPIIAVPASVGYGVAEGGHVALKTMLSSCSNGVTVVNIDNGYGAAMAAHRLLKSL